MSSSDSLLRHLELLRHIPIYPAYRATTTLQEKLSESGFSVNLRTLQRDLKRLEVDYKHLGLFCDDSTMPYRWSLNKNPGLRSPEVEPSTALALCLAESYLTSLLPQSVLDLLAPQFRHARDYLGELNNNMLSDWARRVRAKPNGKALIPAPIDSAAWQAVSQSLLERKCLQVSYLSRSKETTKELLLHPEGIVSRHSISYLIATVDGYDDQRQFALHRIKEAKCLEQQAQQTSSFDIDGFIDSGLNSDTCINEVELVADISPQIAWLLKETPLSNEQSLEPIPNCEWFRLKAKILDDQETLWWILAIGENIVIHKPEGIRRNILKNLCSLKKLYEN